MNQTKQNETKQNRLARAISTQKILTQGILSRSAHFSMVEMSRWVVDLRAVTAVDEVR